MFNFNNLEPEIGWIGLQDFLNEGNFTWADGMDLGSYTNWAANQPDNNGQGQVCCSSEKSLNI